MLPITTIVKFYANPRKNTNNKVITRTLLKIGIIDSAWLSTHSEDEGPQNGELWKVKIVREVEEGKPHGCFLIHPIEKVEKIVPLLVNMYDEEEINGVLIIHPHKDIDQENNINWILPVSTKRSLKDKSIYAAIVALK